MAAILLASNDWLSSQETEGWLRRILVAIFGPISAAKLQALHFFARKAGHVLSYAVLAWLAYRSARASLQDRTTTWLPRAALYALGFALATASLDEIHQSFTQTRTGTVEDVALDMAGSLAAITCIWMVSQWRRRRAVA
jgi:VanZ family protein